MPAVDASFYISGKKNSWDFFITSTHQNTFKLILLLFSAQFRSVSGLNLRTALFREPFNNLAFVYSNYANTNVVQCEIVLLSTGILLLLLPAKPFRFLSVERLIEPFLLGKGNVVSTYFLFHGFDFFNCLLISTFYRF